MKLWQVWMQKAVHNSNAKGFWEHEDALAINVALINSELGEAMESLRMNKRAVPMDDTDTNSPELFNVRFRECRKDTLDDEIADTVIRTLDVAGNIGIGFKPLCFDIRQGILETVTSHKTPLTSINWIIADVCRLDEAIQSRMNSAHLEYRVSVILTKIDALCEKLGINIEESIELKMRYNESRPRLHGKAF